MFFKGSLLSICLIFASSGWAAPKLLTYQGRIVKSDGLPLEYSSVSFEFRITNPSGTCVIYREQKNGFDMTNSKGVFDTPIGAGTKLFPADPSFGLLDAFSNSSVLNCEGGATYTPVIDDGRLLRVQFHDGSGWKLITPDNVIRSVPYAGYSAQAADSKMISGQTIDQIVLKTGIPICSAGYVLTSTTAGVLTCIADTGGASGIVNSIAGTAPIVATDNGSGAYTISATIGTTAGTLAAGNDSRIVNAIQTGAAAGGDLSGTLPNPTVSKIFNIGLSFSSLTSGQFLKYNGTNWINSGITTSDVSGYSNSLAGDITGTQGSSIVSKIQGVTVTASSPLINQFFKYDGTQWSPMSISLSDLPSGSLSGSGTAGYIPYYSASTTLANSPLAISGSLVGLGIASPTHQLELRGAATQTPQIFVTNTNTADYTQLAFASASRQWNVGIGNGSESATGVADKFYIWDNNASAMRMVLDTSGRMGIGTVSPNQLLTVEGPMSLRAQAAPTNTANYGKVYVDSGDANKLKYINPSGTITDLSAAGTAPAPSLSAVTSATATNTLANAGNAQVWNWDSLTTGTGMTLGSTSLTSGNLLKLQSTGTAAASNTQTVLNVATSGANATSTQTTYGAQFTNTHTGTSSTNVGLYASASGATNNYAAIFNSGRVGVGTTAPTSALEVQATTTATSGDATGFVTYLEANPGAASSSDVFNYIGSGTKTGNTRNYTGVWEGLVPEVYHDGTGTIGDARGLASWVTKNNSGPITWAYALYGRVENRNATGAISNAFGLYIDTFNRTGAITNSYGVYVADSTANNYFAGNIGVGVTSPSYKMDINGDIRITGTPYRAGGDIAWTVPSDARLKDVTGHYERGLNDLLKLDMIRFRYKKDNPVGADTSKEYIGVLAQQVEKVIPEAVNRDPKSDFLSLNTTPIFWAMINAIKETYHYVVAVENRFDSRLQRLSVENQRIKDENIQFHQKMKSQDDELKNLKARMEKLERSIQH